MNKNSKKLIISFIIFIFLIALTFIVLFNNNEFTVSLNVLKNIIPGYIIIAIVCALFFVAGEGINIKIMLDFLGKKVSVFNTIKYAFIGFFFSSITPSASGGQPAQVYFMYKDDISPAESSLVLIMQFACFQIITIVFGILSYFYNINLFVSINPIVRTLLLCGIILNAIILLIVILFIFSKNISIKLINMTISFLKLFKLKNIQKIELKLKNELDKYGKNTIIIKKKPLIFIKVLLVVMLEFICLYSIPYFISISFNMNSVSFLNIFTIQAVLFLSVSSLPFPGGVGITEGAFLILYNLIFSKEILGSALTVNRLISFYFPLIISFIIFIITYIKFLKKEKSA